MKKTIFFLCLLFYGLVEEIYGQTNCSAEAINIYGSPDRNERAKSILLTPDNKGLYAVGMIEDSVLIVALDLGGKVLWARTFDIVPGRVDNVTTAILDSDGMIVTVGIAGNYVNGGTIFAFRYNPDEDKVEWSKEYVNTTNRNYSFSILQDPITGNFILNNNPHQTLPGALNDDELFKVDKISGNILSASAQNYNLGGSDQLGDMVYYNNFIYATGRYTDGLPVSKMRNTILKIDPITLNHIWVKMGHIPANETARLYGKDLAVEQDFIYSISHGDPTGTSTSNTKLFTQKTDIDGKLIWIKQYEMPGNNDVAHQLISTGDGFVILAGKNLPLADIVLIKINLDGDVKWAKRFQFSTPVISSIEVDRGNSQLQVIEDKIFVTATGINTNGSSDILVFQTNENGEIDNPCLLSIDVTIQVQDITNPVFYSVNTTKFSAGQQTHNNIPKTDVPSFYPREECVLTDTISSLIESTICFGDSHDGYSNSGVYLDFFITDNGCDSVRTLILHVDRPEKRIDVNLCPGGNFENYIQEGIYVDTLIGVSGDCDTIRFISVSFSPELETSSHEIICNGQNYFGYTTAGIFTDTFKSVSGCDSIRTVSLQVLNDLESSIEATMCEGKLYGYQKPGIYIDTLISLLGCDSVRTLVLQGTSIYIPNVFSPNDDGINDMFVIIQSPEDVFDLRYFGIFDRFGNMTYQTEQWPIIWNGKNRDGDPYPPSVFAYVLIYECGDNRVVENGSITILK